MIKHMKDNYPITDTNDIFVYFEVIGMLSPGSILDIGMFLKRIGAVSRGVMSGVIPNKAKLCGIDLEPNLSIPVMASIYDSVITYENYDTKKDTYDLSIMLRILDFTHINLLPSLIKNCLQYSSKVLMDSDSFLKFKDFFAGTIQELTSEDNKYYLIDLGK